MSIELSGEYHEDVNRLTAEIERLQSFKTAYMEWSDKPDLVQESAHWSELGLSALPMIPIEI